MLIIPHIILRILCLILFSFLSAALIPLAVFHLQQKEKENRAISLILLIILIILFVITWFHVLICQLKCCDFIRRSAKTGFSFSKTFEIRHPSVSSTDERMEAIPTVPQQSVTAAGATERLQPLENIPKLLLLHC
ncbi:hypothetical protein LOAG_01959 [Loa loa]|uniref:Uncharacterized protein n=1 Tax=Loa loa TaxID=7209 RepID=A0A1S0U9R2_LOALO|nr:hypothetical protein LOAG_01959 [Loa loa]EFO26526.1 hypothetical protein LOAG_01959 [Loa loa]